MVDFIKSRFLTFSAENRVLLLHSTLGLVFRIFGALAAFIFSLVAARKLGAEQSGYFFLGLTTITFLAAVCRMGLDNTVLKFTGAAMPNKKWGEVRSVLKKSILVASSLSLACSLILFISAEWLAVTIFEKPAMYSVFKMMAPGLVFLALFTLLALSLQGLQRVISSVFISNICVNLVLIIALLLLSNSDSLTAAAFYSVAAGLTLLFGWWMWLGMCPPTGEGAIAWKLIFASCMPLWVVVMMSQLIQFSGLFIAGVFVDSASLAQLVVAQRTAMLASLILIAVNLVVAPRFAGLYKQGDLLELQRLAIYSVRLMMLFALPILITMLLFPEFIMGLFGPEFADSGFLLQVLAVGQFFCVATGSVGYLLSMSGHETDMRNVMLFSGPFSIALSLLLIPIYGVEGSALATSIALATKNLIAVCMVKKRLGFNTLAVWKRS